MQLTGKIVLVTGGSRGIGRAVALRLAREQPEHIVIAYCLNHRAARRTVADIEAIGPAASALATDVSKPDLMAEMFASVRERFGRLDIFISNAARAAFRPLTGLNLRNWQRNMDLNARAFLLGSQMAAELMGDEGGRIVGLSSLGASYYIKEYGGLGAAKAAIECLARYLAAELAPRKINVNVVSSGFVDTESMRLNPSYDEVKEYFASRAPAGRVATPEDLAGVVAFLCLPDSRWIQGQTIVADGGLSLVL
jgi:NAD(P)-dependent dehydrogenase (short-subunit alcohol dehydrogenase family)